MTLVNTARADLVDESATADAIRSGLLTSYAADTLDTESHGSGESPLLADDLADRVIITPHLGAQTVQAIDRMGVAAVNNVLLVLNGRSALNPVTV
jgi:Lactate dehydrogenase and related dehydrogenases